MDISKKIMVLSPTFCLKLYTRATFLPVRYGVYTDVSVVN